MLTRLTTLALAGMVLSLPVACQSGSGPTAKAPATTPVELTEITYAGLEAAVKEQLGQVIVIDVWFRG